MNRAATIIFRIIGAVAIFCAAFGFYYNVTMLATDFSGAFTANESQYDTPYFYPAFYVMSAICIGCYTLLIIFGVQFIRGRAFHVRWFTTLLLFEIVYFFSLGMLWLAPNIGMSVAAASGVANGGLMAQFFILFPIWAPLLAFWARRHLNNSTNVV